MCVSVRVCGSVRGGRVCVSVRGGRVCVSVRGGRVCVSVRGGRVCVSVKIGVCQFDYHVMVLWFCWCVCCVFPNESIGKWCVF